MGIKEHKMWLFSAPLGYSAEVPGKYWNASSVTYKAEKPLNQYLMTRSTTQIKSTQSSLVRIYFLFGSSAYFRR